MNNSNQGAITMNNWKKTFYTIWVGQAFSQLSSSILQFAVVWYLTDTTKSGMVLSLAMLMGFLPQGILGPFIGVYIDRFSRKKIMILADLAIAAVSVLLVFAAADGKASVTLILVVLFCRAIGTAFHTPTLQAVTPQLVPKEELAKCSGYTQSLQSISLILSPAIAAVLYSSWSMSAIVILDIIGALIAVSLVAVSKIPQHKAEHLDTTVHVISEAMEGLKILCKNKGVFGLVMVSALYTMALMPISALFPLMSMGYFGGNSTNASIVEIAFAAGYMVAAVILGRWGGTKNKIHTILGSYVLMAISLIGTGLLPENGFYIFVVFAIFMGVSGPFFWGMYTTLLQHNYKQQYLGRIMSITGSIRLIAGPLALVASGKVADKYGEENWFLVAGILLCMAIVIIISVPAIRNCDKK